MFFDKSNLSVTLLDVIELKQENVNAANSNRNYHALSFRFSADAILQTATESHKLADDSLCFIPAYLPYRRITHHDDLIALHFQTSNGSFDQLESFTPSNPAAYRTLFSKIWECWNEKKVGYGYTCTALLYQILALCYQEHFVAKEEENRILPSIRFLEAHFKDPKLSIDDIAKQSFLSTVYFRKLFKEQYGISPMKYIIRLRIAHAVSLIETGYYSLSEVATLSGYEDYPYFSAEFKRLRGLSPSEFQHHYHTEKKPK